MNTKIATLFSAMLLMVPPPTLACPELLQHTMKKLHSKEHVDLCTMVAGRPMLIINTASHCGYTPQFKALEAMHQRYQERGIVFVGVPSNSFRQEASTEAATADVCYVNYGVSFTMLAPVDVTGDDAHPLFAELARQSEAPRWNFYKYVIDSEGVVRAAFPSTTTPNDPALTGLLDDLAQSW